VQLLDNKEERPFRDDPERRPSFDADANEDSPTLRTDLANIQSMEELCTLLPTSFFFFFFPDLHWRFTPFILFLPFQSKPLSSLMDTSETLSDNRWATSAVRLRKTCKRFS
jgi:hypothetical protein